MTLPSRFLKRRTIGGMFPEEEGYAPPGALIVHEDRKCFLNKNYSISDLKTLYASLKVIRRKDGSFAVDISGCNSERWETSTYEGLEVVEIIGYSNKEPEPKAKSEEETVSRTKRRRMDLT